MMLSVVLPPDASEFDAGAQNFLTLLRGLKARRYFDGEFDSYFGKPLQDETGYLNGFRDSAVDNLPGQTMHNIHIVTGDYFGADYWWGTPDVTLTVLVGNFMRSHPRYGYSIDHFVETIDTVITWQRPQHVRCGPSMYFLNDHPLDKARSGVGWLGWVPFDLQPSEVPEAAILLPMQGGTFLASQRDWWIAAGPDRDVAAVQRAQALELRLNVLGVLPTTVELRRGDWGQGGVRP
jgi:hypothetical protein